MRVVVLWGLRREADMQPPQPQLQPQTAEAPRAAKPVQDRVLSQLTMQFEVPPPLSLPS